LERELGAGRTFRTRSVGLGSFGRDRENAREKIGQNG